MHAVPNKIQISEVLGAIGIHAGLKLESIVVSNAHPVSETIPIATAIMKQLIISILINLFMFSFYVPQFLVN